MHSRKSRRALDLDLRTNSLESRELLATPTPTATVAIFCRSTNLTKTGLYLGAQQYVVWPSNPRFATVTLTKPLTVHQAPGFTFTTATSYPPRPPATTPSPTPSTPITNVGFNGFVPASIRTIKAGTKVTFQYGRQVHLLKLIEATTRPHRRIIDRDPS